jgi:pimeloyl-ACP methyl ester carboxylesterase
VAMTSYRRNGRVVRDGMEDVNQLRDYIEKNYGRPNLCLLEGRSMGGCIVTLLAENYPHLYHVRVFL